MKAQSKVIKGRAPLRLSLAGGGTDLNDVFEKYGGCVINVTIDKYVHAEVSFDKRTTLNGEEPDEFTKEILKRLNAKKIKIITWCEVPWGRGLGSSSTYSVLIAKLISQLQGKNMSDDEIAELVYGVENTLGKCGWQDQYAAISGGFNFMEFSKLKLGSAKVIYSLRMKPKTIKELEEHLCLVYTGIEHNSGMIQKNKPKIKKDDIEKLKKLAIRTRDCLFKNDIEAFGDILNEQWKIKKNSKTTSRAVDNLIMGGMVAGARGARVVGAGKGGYVLFFIEPDNMNLFRKTMNYFCYEILDFKFSNEGVEIWEKI